MPKKNTVLSLAITDLNNLGYGVGRAPDGKVVFVANAADGDLCEVKIIKDARDYAVGRIVRMLAFSPHRTVPHCTARGCGGCAYTAVDYSHELMLKRRTVETAFHKVGLSPTVEEVRTTGRMLHYRNKAQYPVQRGEDGSLRIGFFAPKSHRVTEAASCPLAPPIFREILEEVRTHALQYGVPPYDEQSGTGLLRHIYLRASHDCREVLLTLVVCTAEYPKSRELVEALTSRFPTLVGILLNINPDNTNVILGKQFVTLFGRDSITDTLAGVRLKISPAAFYQVNRDAAELLYAEAARKAALTGSEVLLDLYCGTGSIGLSMASGCRRLLGVEIVPEAIACARQNAEAAGIQNATFAVGDAAELPAILAREGIERPDVVLLDPPRAGVDEALLATLVGLAPSRIVYISCNPTTLARDVAYLTAHGFAAGEVTPFDMFPRTGHVESVVCLTRK